MQGRTSAPPTVDVTAVIPAHNRASHIRRSIDSVLAQRPAVPAEVIVVDDGSTDDTAAVAQGLGAKVIRHPRNRGPSAARNSGIEAAACGWVAFLDSDDEWLPDHLDSLLALGDGYVFVGNSAVAKNDRVSRWIGPVSRAESEVGSPRRLLVPENYVPTSGIMVRREQALAVGGYVEGTTHAEDLDFMVRLLERGPALVTQRVGAIYHSHVGQMSLDRSRSREAHRKVIESYRDRRWWSRTLLRRWEGVCAWDEGRYALAQGDRSGARRAFLRIAADPRRAAGALQLLFRRWRVRRRTEKFCAESRSR